MLSFGTILIIQQLLCSQLNNNLFSIGASGCYEIADAKSCGFNTVYFWYDEQDLVDRRMALASKLGVRVILARAKLPETPCITGISGGQRSVYEAESRAFAHDQGQKIYDPAASNDTAWVVYGKSDVWQQHALWTNEQYLFQPITFKYYAHFRLKISSNIQSTPVCSLLVLRKLQNETVVEASRCLTGNDFLMAGEYQTFVVNFDLDPGQGDKMDYAVKYLGAGDSLYSDFVDVMDVVAYKLKESMFDDDIRSIAQYYNQYPAMYRYYLWDEITRDQIWASGQVQRLLTQNQPDYKGGIQALYLMDVLNNYLDSVRTKELLVDFYPLYGRTNYYGRTPVDSGAIFQNRLTNMCNFLSVARYQVKSHPGSKLWFMPQAFGHAITNQAYDWKRKWSNQFSMTDEGWWREPTVRELRCMIWLALAYGSKGIMYYRYQSLTEHFDLPEYDGYRDDHWIVGLTDPSGRVKRPAWYTVRDINKELNILGSTLLSLSSDTVFSTNNALPVNSFMKEVSDTLIQIGTFHDKTHDYFIIVNRHCLPQDTVDLSLRIAYEKSIYLQDCLTKEKVISRSRRASAFYDFSIRLNPGEGKLFRLNGY